MHYCTHTVVQCGVSIPVLCSYTPYIPVSCGALVFSPGTELCTHTRTVLYCSVRHLGCRLNFDSCPHAGVHLSRVEVFADFFISTACEEPEPVPRFHYSTTTGTVLVSMVGVKDTSRHPRFLLLKPSCTTCCWTALVRRCTYSPVLYSTYHTRTDLCDTISIQGITKDFDSQE